MAPSLSPGQATLMTPSEGTSPRWTGIPAALPDCRFSTTADGALPQGRATGRHQLTSYPGAPPGPALALSYSHPTLWASLLWPQRLEGAGPTGPVPPDAPHVAVPHHKEARRPRAEPTQSQAVQRTQHHPHRGRQTPVRCQRGLSQFSHVQQRSTPNLQSPPPGSKLHVTHDSRNAGLGKPGPGAMTLASLVPGRRLKSAACKPGS